jgi:hypothetical protein
MIQARIHQGGVEVQQPIQESWEGQQVCIVPATPDDPSPDLEENLVTLHALGPMEFEAGEREWIDGQLAELDRVSSSNLSEIADILFLDFPTCT